MNESKNTETAEEPQRYQPKTDQEIRQLALDVTDGRVFLTTDPHEIKLSFSMVIAFLTEEGRKDLEERDVVALYEYISAAGPRRVNGLPMFMSASTLTREEFNRLHYAHKEVKAFREKFVGQQRSRHE
jgi:hypothetical protein